MCNSGETERKKSIDWSIFNAESYKILIINEKMVSQNIKGFDPHGKVAGWCVSGKSCKSVNGNDDDDYYYDSVM